MESDSEDAIPEMTKNEMKLIKDVISEVSDNPSEYTTGDQLFTLFSKYQVQPEKQLKLMYAVALKLSDLSEKCKGETSNQYLRLSTLATVAVQEKFGLTQQESSSRRGRQAKDNAKINMTSYFDLETTLLNEDSDNESPTKKQQKGDKVEWSDSELKETEPLQTVKAVEDSTASKASTATTDPTSHPNRSKLSALPGSRISQRKRMIDIVCIDSSSDEESDPPAKDSPAPTHREKLKPASRQTQKSRSTKKTKSAEQSKPKPPVSDAGITRVLQASEKSDEKSNKRDTSKPEETVPKEKRAEGGSKGKPVGVVKATPRTTPPDTQRSVNNIIKQDEALILNFKKGHYPTFQTSYTHLVVCKKENNDLYTDTAPQMSVILEMDGKVVASEELKEYELKQFVHNESGQYLLGEKDDELYILVPGVINKDKRKA